MSVYGSVVVQADEQGNGVFGRIQAMEFDPTLNNNVRGADGRVAYCREGAIEWAQQQVMRWDASHQFTGCKVRFIVNEPKTIR